MRQSFKRFRAVVCGFGATLVWLAGIGTTGALAADEAAFAPEQLEFFEKEVRPLLAEHCLKCHGADKPKGGLRLDSRAAVLQGGDSGPGVVPGKPAESEIIKAVQYDPDGYQMPPEGKLPEADIAILVKWAMLGAPWPAHATSDAGQGISWEQKFDERAQRWSFQPLKRTPPPAVQNREWSRTPIDRFILAKVEAAGLTPAGEADRRTWIRRAYLDTLGLPPAPEAVEAFVSDESPDAFEKVVDELLASPRFGERWGRHWLDLARYAESRGHEFDFDVPNPWHYRDYVVQSINDDLPYDQFVREHLAGDLISEELSGESVAGKTSPHPSVATGFWYLGEWVHSPVDIRKDETERVDNMLDVFSKTFLGLTVACARCHDHKFDPISQKDYYALAGYIKSTSYAQRPFETLEHNRRIQRELRAVDASAAGPIVAAYHEAARPALNDLNHYLLAAREVLAAPVIAEGTAAAPNSSFEDFESGTYEGWEITGDAFGKIPQTQATIANYQGSVAAHGKFFVNSHQIRDGGRGDDHVGTMTSREFPIEKDTLRFLIGGGPHAGRTCLNLLIEGRVVITTTGHSSNTMRAEQWDLRPYRGKSARLQIVDLERGGWGNIGIDHLEFANHPASQIETPAMGARIAAIAKAKGLRAERLTAWVRHAVRASEDPKDRFHDWARFAMGQAAFLVAKVRTGPQAEPGRPLPLIAQDGVYYDLPTAEQPRLWLSDQPENPIAAVATSPHEVRVDPDFAGIRERDGSMRDVGAIGSLGRAGRTLRTARLTLETGQIAALVRGGCSTYVVVDSHAVVQGPLHGTIVRKHPENPQWHWVLHDVTRYKGHSAHVEIVADASGDFVCDGVYEVAQPPMAVERHPESLLNLAGTDRLPLEALDWMRLHPDLFGLDSPEVRATLARVAAPFIEARRSLVQQIQAVSSSAPVMLEGSGTDEDLLIRGNSNKPSGLVPRRFIEVFHGQGPEEQQPGSGRLELAGQLVDPLRTPIVPRVVVNRVWHHYFGRGLVPTPDDFGHMGELPSHPELLDWLATELVREECSLKQIHRLILLSATYRLEVRGEDSQSTAAKLLFAHRSPKRLEGEIIRDTLFHLSGRADDRLYGPSVPIALNDFQDGRGKPGSGPVDGAGRRSLYLSIRRNFAESFLTAFDLPNPHTTMGRRSVSNVPAQALALLNSPMVVQQTRLWGERLCRELPDGDSQARISRLYQLAFARPATEGELRVALEFIRESAQSLQQPESSPQVWGELCHALINTKEFVYIP